MQSTPSNNNSAGSSKHVVAGPSKGACRPPQYPNTGFGPSPSEEAFTLDKPNPSWTALAPTTRHDVTKISPPPTDPHIKQDGGYFHNASNLVFNNPTMVDARPQITYPIERSSKELRWLQRHIMPGAEFDSSARDPPPRCHPGTRTTIIQRAHDWFANDKREKNLWWLHGPAGVGKSAIIQTLAESESTSSRLGASLFFSRPNGRNNPQQVFPTIAYQLAVRDPPYKEYITELMADPASLDKTISEQFKRLITQPFGQRDIRYGSKVWIIALDGLDECSEDHERHHHTRPERHSDHYQCEIVQLISAFVQQYPLAPLIWIIASRPEPHLKAVFARSNVMDSFWEEEVPVDSDEACQDVERYLLSAFDEIRQEYPGHIATPTWPTNDQFLKIAKAASGLFAFASVITLFIGDPYVGNPVDQLACVLSVIDNLRVSYDQRNPLAALDAIYTEIIRRVPPDTWKVTKRLIAARIHPDLASSFSTLIYTCNALRITQSTAATALRHLHSVVHIPRTTNIGNTTLEFYHASFRDYLKDASRSHEYSINDKFMDTVASEWEEGLLWLLKQLTVTPIHTADEDTTPESTISDQVINICFPWPPNSDWSKMVMLRQMINQAVGISWVEVIRTYVLMNAIPPRLDPHAHILAYGLIHILDAKYSSKLVREYMNSSSIKPLLSWLGRLVERFPDELAGEGLLFRTTLGASELTRLVDLKQFSYMRCKNYYLAYNKVPKPQPHFISSEGYRKVIHWAERAPSTDVNIWGRAGKRRLAIFSVGSPGEAYLLPFLREVISPTRAEGPLLDKSFLNSIAGSVPDPRKK